VFLSSLKISSACRRCLVRTGWRRPCANTATSATSSIASAPGAPCPACPEACPLASLQPLSRQSTSFHGRCSEVLSVFCCPTRACQRADTWCRQTHGHLDRHISHRAEHSAGRRGARRRPGKAAALCQRKVSATSWSRHAASALRPFSQPRADAEGGACRRARRRRARDFIAAGVVLTVGFLLLTNVIDLEDVEAEE
jgi:hypothetical protein